MIVFLVRVCSCAGKNGIFLGNESKNIDIMTFLPILYLYYLLIMLLSLSIIDIREFNTPITTLGCKIRSGFTVE